MINLFLLINNIKIISNNSPRCDTKRTKINKKREKNCISLLTAIEEHISDDGMLLVDLEWMTAQHNTLGNDTIRINWQQVAQSNELLHTYTIIAYNIQYVFPQIIADGK